MPLTKDQIELIEKKTEELKIWADNQSYSLPCATKVQLTPSWRYKEVIMVLLEKTSIGAKIEKDFVELDQLHQEYESFRGKSITEENEEELRMLVDSLKGTLYDLAETLQQIAEMAREEIKSEKPMETAQKAQSSFSAVAISSILIIVFELLVYKLPVTWVINHPNSYGIQGSIICLIPCLVVGFFKPTWRKWFWAGAVLAFLAVLLSLIGGPR